MNKKFKEVLCENMASVEITINTMLNQKGGTMDDFADVESHIIYAAKDLSDRLKNYRERLTGTDFTAGRTVVRRPIRYGSP